ncbi:MAG: hypothetical protein IJM24_09445 [Clostridia bacterium]|nr:hypothetical protein [Clostridia bacterium]
MIELDAFFYEDNYYLFPGGVDNIDSLVRFIRRSGPDLEVRLLSRENCVPPCFPHSAVRDSVIRDIDARRVFPARVVLMEQDEYDALLRRLLETQCRYCHRYSGDVSRPADYYTETPLLEPCTDRLTKEEFSASGKLRTGYEPYFSVDDFWNDFMQKEEGLREAIDHGEMARATTELSDLLYNAGFSEYLFPALSMFSYTDAQGGHVRRYILMLTGAGFLCANMVAAYFAKMVPERVKKRWDVYPYVIRGLYSYWPGVTELDVAGTPPMLRVTYLEQQDSFQVFVFADWDAEKVAELMPPDYVPPADLSDEDVPGIVFCANYLYLCGIIGEDRLRGACLELAMFPASELVPDGSTVTPEEFDRMIDLQIRDKSKLLPERTMKEIELEGVAELRNVSFVETASDQLTFDLLLGGDNVLSYMWEREIAVGVLHLSKPADNDMIEYLRARLVRVLEEPGAAQLFGISTGEDGAFFDLLVWDKFVTKRTLKRIAPMFRPFGAEFTLMLGEDRETFAL